MQIYKTFLKISLRKIGPCIIYFVILIGICISLSKATKDYTPEKINIAVIDRDNTELSKGLYNYIVQTQKIVEIGTEDTWPDYFFYHYVDYILIIDEGFEANILQGNTENVVSSYKIPESGTTYIASSSISSFIENLSFYINSGYDKGTSIKNAVNTSTQPVVVNTLTSDAGRSTSIIHNFFTILPYVILSIMISCLGLMLIVWNKPEIKKRNDISRLSLTSRNISLILAMLTYTAIIFVLIIILAAAMFKNDLFTRLGLFYSINAAIYMFVCIGITFIVAELSKKNDMLPLWSNIIALSTSFLCGVFVPQTYLPEKVISFSKCLPTYWYILVTEDLNINNGKLSNFSISAMLVQMAFGIVFICIGLVIVKYRQQQKNLSGPSLS